MSTERDRIVSGGGGANRQDRENIRTPGFTITSDPINEVIRGENLFL